MYPNPQAHWSAKTVVMDCLLTCKGLAIRQGNCVLESATPKVKSTFEKIQRDHVEMATELWNLAATRGWYPPPRAAVEQHEQELSSMFTPPAYGGGMQSR